MLRTALRTLRIDLDREVEKIRGQIEFYRQHLTQNIKSCAQEAATALGFAALAAAMFVGLFVVGLLFVYVLVAQHFGSVWGLATVGAILAIGGILFLARASMHVDLLARSTASIIPPAPAPIVPPVRPVTREPIGLARFLPELPSTASAAERVVHYASTHVVNAAEGAIDQAEEVVRTGSRPAILATLAAVVATGFFLGRTGRVRI